MKFKKIIFDFDGVILKSHKVKTQAFYDLFLRYGDNVALKAKNYHINKIGISRYIKFKFILKKYTKLKINNKLLEDLSIRFTKICFNKIIRLKISKKLLIFIRKNKTNCKFYISTGTPQNEIEKILSIKKIKNLFTNVYGSPLKKIDHINQIRKRTKHVLYIGDSMEDYLSSKKAKISFLLKEHNENKKDFKSIKVKKIKNYSNIKKIIDTF